MEAPSPPGPIPSYDGVRIWKGIGVAPQHIGERSLGRGTRLNPRIRRVVEDIAILSWGLLAVTDSPMLAVAVPSDGWPLNLPILLWDQRLAAREQGSRELCASPGAGPALDALCVAADELFLMLQAAQICPANTAGVSIVTDGTGVALTADLPAADTADAGWLLALAGQRGRATTVLPMADDGIWALLRCEAEGASIH
jgi:hypothetical protein